MNKNKKKVIIVDNNPVNLQLAHNTLTGSYDVFMASGAEMLFRLLHEMLPDIILLDVSMPGMGGHEVIKMLKSDPATAEIPVILLTSKSDAAAEVTGFALGAADYISKPFSPPILRKRVEIHVLLASQKKGLKRNNMELRRLVDEKTREILELQNGILKTMSNLVEYRDIITGGHVERTEALLSLLLEEMRNHAVYLEEIEPWDVNLLLQSAQLHDVGKIAIRNNILMKPGPLTYDEFTEMKKHTIFGEKVIDKIMESAKENMFLTHAKIMAGTHHEKWNGSGYPRGMAGFNIPLQGRLMAVVDVYDALTSSRPYKKPLPHRKALEIITAARGVHFDPAVVDVFVRATSHF
ncbi:MAG: response regulator [Treponema sp.]|jgi:putative two-component system response regulator|nr:response regulator [Treponema sp.]